MTSLHNQLKARAMTMMIQGAIGAYVESQGKSADEHMKPILEVVEKNFDGWMGRARDTVIRARAAGLLTADPRFEAEVLNSFVTALALSAAAEVIGEPATKDDAKTE